MKPLPMSRAAAVLTALALTALALPVGAFAQSAVQPAPSTAPQVMQAASSSAPAMPPAVSEKVEAHIKALRAELEITPAEVPQWNIFAQVMRDNAAQMDQAFTARGARLSVMNAVEDLQSYSQIAQIQSANLQKLAMSFQVLYNTFPASQQKIADAVFRAKASHGKNSPMKPTTP